MRVLGVGGVHASLTPRLYASRPVSRPQQDPRAAPAAGAGRRREGRSSRGARPRPQEHLFLVCELLRANLYEFQKYNREAGDPLYFTLARVQSIARQARAPPPALNGRVELLPRVAGLSCRVVQARPEHTPQLSGFSVGEGADSGVV